MKKNIYLLGITVIVVLVFITGISFAFWSLNLKQTGEGSYTEIQKDYGTPSSTDIQGIYNNYIEQDLNKINNTSGLPKYDCKVEINQKTGRVNKVSFTQK